MSKAHEILKEKAVNLLREQGYLVFEEYRVRIEGRLFIVDVAGFKNGNSVAIECGRTRHSKIQRLRGIFGEVRRFYYTPRINPTNQLEVVRPPKPSHRKVSIEILKNLIAISHLYQYGKIQVPKDVRKVLQLEDGDRIIWYNEKGTMFVKRLE